MANDLHFGVVIGINKYPEFNSLHSARGDALAFAEWLGKTDGGDLPSGNIEVILSPDASASIIFKKGTSRTGHLVTFEFATPYHGRILLLDGKLKELGAHDVGEGSWSTELPNGIYRVTPAAGQQPEVTFQNGGYFSVMGEAQHVIL